ncbi:MAG: hypothetical protein Q8M16_19275 [Pirellulaceae bacterium]|nr:hypothetical protein [Pirellulaceae bacterium]
MIRPEKHLNLNLCVLRIATIVLSHLQRHRVESFHILLQKVRNKAGDDAEVWFIPALDLLFLLGRINYLPQRDTVEYVAPMPEVVT